METGGDAHVTGELQIGQVGGATQRKRAAKGPLEAEPLYEHDLLIVPAEGCVHLTQQVLTMPDKADRVVGQGQAGLEGAPSGLTAGGVDVEGVDDFGREGHQPLDMPLVQAVPIEQTLSGKPFIEWAMASR